jgi:small multidrug resistance pump
VWAATGVALTAVGSRLLFDEPLTPLMGAGLALIIVGVLLVELGVHAG